MSILSHLSGLSISCGIRRYDEGTAYLPVVQTKRQVPVSDKFNFIALDVDGHDLPSDW